MNSDQDNLNDDSKISNSKGQKTQQNNKNSILVKTNKGSQIEVDQVDQVDQRRVKQKIEDKSIVSELKKRVSKEEISCNEEKQDQRKQQQKEEQKQQQKSEVDPEVKKLLQNIFRTNHIRKQDASIQTGVHKNVGLLAYTEETYAPQFFKVHSKIGSKGALIQEIQIQVGASLVVQPQKVMNSAKQERILLDSQKYAQFLQNQKQLTSNQKSVYIHVEESIMAKKAQILIIHDLIKDHVNRYATIMKEFSVQCTKVEKEDKQQIVNKFINIGQELKEPFFQLIRFRQSSSENYIGIHYYIEEKTVKELDKVYSNYADGTVVLLGGVFNRKKNSNKMEEQFKKQASKVHKMFNRVRESKKQEDDFFVEIAKVISLEATYRLSLKQWGVELIELRKVLVDVSELYFLQFQQVLNTLKGEISTLHGIRKSKFQSLKKTRPQVVEDISFRNLVNLVDSDFIRSSLEPVLKRQVTDIMDNDFCNFVQMLHAKIILGEPRQLLMKMIGKKFTLKDQKQELIHTISGNLVVIKKENLQIIHKITVKQIKAANSVENGIIQIEQIQPGIIFDSTKKITIQFKDADRAEELLCFLGQGDIKNS